MAGKGLNLARSGSKSKLEINIKDIKKALMMMKKEEGSTQSEPKINNFD